MKLPAASIKKIAVFRALQLGDMLCAIPAIRTLRSAYPSSRITLLGLPWAKSMADRFPDYFNDFIHFPGYPGLPEQPFNAHAFLQFLSLMQHENYDLVLQMQGNGTLVNPMIELLGAANTAGFFYKDVFYPDNGLFVEYPEHTHEIEKHLRLMDFLGLDTKGSYLEFPLYERDFAELNALKLPITNGEYVCIHPGSRGAWRQWPPEHFAALADYCAGVGLKVLITGTRDELDLVTQVTTLMKHEAIIIAGKTSLGAMAALIEGACLLISNCTGVSHIAAAVKTPGIVISMDGEPERWGPLNHDLHRTIDWTKNKNFAYVMKELKDLLGIHSRIHQFRNDVPGVIVNP